MPTCVALSNMHILNSKHSQNQWITEECQKLSILHIETNFFFIPIFLLIRNIVQNTSLAKGVHIIITITVFCIHQIITLRKINSHYKLISCPSKRIKTRYKMAPINHYFTLSKFLKQLASEILPIWFFPSFLLLLVLLIFAIIRLSPLLIVGGKVLRNSI